jgi:enoyl-CoA hydratase/3-hydroxyacyl-CoA dehydrogenase
MVIINFARAQAAKRARHLRHPQLCLDAIQEGVARGGAAGLKKVSAV